MSRCLLTFESFKEIGQKSNVLIRQLASDRDNMLVEGETAHYDQAPLRATEQYVHSSLVAQESECPCRCRVVIVAHHRDHDAVGLAALERVDGSAIGIRVYCRNKSGQVSQRAGLTP